MVLSADIKRVNGEFRVFSKGGRIDTGMEAIEWIKKGVDLGAGEVVVNSIDTDGVKKGFDIEMLKAVCEAVNVPVIASGGAGCAEDFVKLFKEIPDIEEATLEKASARLEKELNELAVGLIPGVSA